MRLTSWMLAPIALAQALWVGTRALRMPEAAGPRAGTCGQGAPLRLLIVGDSSAAGVGVPEQSQALSGRLTELLARDCDVTWRLIAKTGATAGSTLQQLRQAELGQFDCAVLALGVNDVKNGVSLTNWAANYRAIVDVLRSHCAVSQVYLSAVPPLGAFPLLPWPLNALLGDRAQCFDEVLKVIASDDGIHHVPFDRSLDVSVMAEDGFHPGAALYEDWAKAVYNRMRADLGVPE